VSQENVEIMRAAYARVTARGVEGMLEFATEDIVWISDQRFPGGGTHTGMENVRGWLNQLWIYEEFSIDVEEIIDLDDRALGITRCQAVPPDAPKVDWLWCHLVSFRDGLISQAQSFLDRDSALEAAGLSEQDGRQTS
jgi:ketosteroid isomerase-like protein